MTTDLLRQQLAEVAERRAKAETCASLVKVLREDFEAEHADVIAEAASAKAALAESEANARALAVAIHGTTGEKKPIEGVAIRLTTKLTYKDEDALAWCRETKMALIPESVDRKALERIAKATPLPFVTITEEPSATLASDLSQYLAPAPSPDLATVTEEDLNEAPF